MDPEGQPGVETVRAAMAGDQRALDKLVAGYLPLAYNVVGRALDGHADVDDVVQETMLRVVHSLDGLRDPARFRSWLLAIAMHQIRDRARARQAMLARGVQLDDAAEVADPGADFVDLTLLRLELSGQRQEIAEATRWLDQRDRELLSLWWLEASGELTRDELAEAFGITTQHAAVRVQRMKAQLEASRAVVRALWAQPPCAELAAVVDGWDGQPDKLWRKRIARHTRGCLLCDNAWTGLVPAERLLVGLALVPLPVAMVTGVLASVHAAGQGTAAVAAAATKGVAVTSAVHVGTHAGKAAGWVGGMLTKPVLAAAGVAVIGAGAVLTYTGSADPTPNTVVAPVSVAAPPSVAPTAAGAAPPAPTSAPTSAAPTSSRSTSPPTPPARVGPAYGSNVDKPDSVPPVDQRPGALPRRAEGPAVAMSGKYEPPSSGAGTTYLMNYRGDSLTITGRGYFQIRYQIMWSSRPGPMVMPTWTGLTGKLFHVASGGGRRMDDTRPGATDPRDTWMGQPDRGYVTLPDGAQQMWQNEFFYVDGAVTLHNNERGADYNLVVSPVTWDAIVRDIDQGPDPGRGLVRYGMVRDTGDDGCPVPQYLTTRDPADPATVPQGGELG